MKCPNPNCRKNVSAQDAFCGHCGTKIEQARPDTTRSSGVTTSVGTSGAGNSAGVVTAVGVVLFIVGAVYVGVVSQKNALESAIQEIKEKYPRPNSADLQRLHQLAVEAERNGLRDYSGPTASLSPGARIPVNSIDYAWSLASTMAGKHDDMAELKRNDPNRDVGYYPTEYQESKSRLSDLLRTHAQSWPTQARSIVQSWAE